MSNYFTPAMNSLVIPRAKFRVTQQARCPTSDSEDQSTYAYFPLTIAAAGDLSNSSSSTWSGTVQHRLWAYGCTSSGHRVGISNPVQPYITFSDGRRAGLDYSTIAKANAATAARLSYSAGYAQYEADGVSGWGDIADTAGLTVYAWADANTNSATLFTISHTNFVSALDIIVLPSVRLCDMTTGGKELSIDYEPQDSRATSDTTALISQCATLAHEKRLKLVLYTNPLDGAGGTPYNGILGVLDTVLATVDFFDLLVYANNMQGPPATSLAYQMNLFTNPDYTKFQVIYGIGTSGGKSTTLSDAQAVTNIMRQYGFAGVEIFYFSGTPGGDCSTNADFVHQLAAVTGVPSC